MLTVTLLGRLLCDSFMILHEIGMILPLSLSSDFTSFTTTRFRLNIRCMPKAFIWKIMPLSLLN